MLPAFVGLGLAVVGPVFFLAWLYRALGVGGLVLGVVLLAAVTIVGMRWRRAAVRRRGGIYTHAELVVLDEHGLAAAAERMLQRDGLARHPDAGESGGRACTHVTAAAASSTWRSARRTRWWTGAPRRDRRLCGKRAAPGSTG
ncbi:hypothetical protein [Streptomyces sp. NPDC001381]|uniref:hypothetical protein n=1 Tax=Streptomyces sp. NPDC001381 TaxID=3364567 RepID=UPI0036CC2F3C